MNGEEHYREAERLIVVDDVHEPPTRGNIELAQVHALLALANRTLADRDREALHRIGFEIGLWQSGAYGGPGGADAFARNVIQAYGGHAPAVPLLHHEHFRSLAQGGGPS